MSKSRKQLLLLFQVQDYGKRIIGADVCMEIQDFFRSGPLLSQLKATCIVLVPKGENANSPDKFRPISYLSPMNYLRLSIVSW